MNTTLPLIGITSGHRTCGHGTKTLCVSPSYVRAVEVAGGLPLLIPVTLHIDTLEAIYRRLDAVLLPGGGDVLPDAYGAEVSPRTHAIDEARDVAEFALVRWAVRDDKPLFAICRGHQVLNVALGGTLYQHIPDDFDTKLSHDQSTTTHRHAPTHTVSIVSGSRLAAALGVGELSVNSMHHQAVGRVAEPLRVVAQSTDGVIEGLEHPDQRFALSVQWHPEELTDTVPVMRRLFKAFVQAAGG